MLSTANYTSLYIYSVPNRKIPDFLQIQAAAAKIYVELGALADITFEPQKLEPIYGSLGFRETLQVTEGESIFFSLSTFKDREHHDSVMAQVDRDERILGLYDEICKILDISRIVRGEFSRAF